MNLMRRGGAITLDGLLISMVLMAVSLTALSIVSYQYGRCKAGIPLGARAYYYQGEYYWKWRGVFPLGEQEKRITKEHYDVFIRYESVSRALSLLAAPLGLPPGIWLVLRRLNRKLRYRAETGKWETPKL
jgi:hypothetical protein